MKILKSAKSERTIVRRTIQAVNLYQILKSTKFSTYVTRGFGRFLVSHLRMEINSLADL